MSKWIWTMLIVLGIVYAGALWAPDVMNLLNGDRMMSLEINFLSPRAEANNEGMPINIVVNAAPADMSWVKELAESSRAQLAVMQQQLGVDEAMLRIEQARDRCAQIQRDTGVVFDVVAYLAGHDPCPAPPQ